MLSKLSETLKKTTDKIANAIFLDKNLVDSIVRDLQRALIEADVNILLVKKISDKIKQSALDERISGLDKKEHLIKLLHDEILSILGKKTKLELKKTQNRIMLLGLYGAGKTTTIAKLGNYFSKRGKNIVLVGLDVHRPAAPEQLQQLAEKNKLNVFVDLKEKDPKKIWDAFQKSSKSKKYDVVLIDTAGRHNLDKNLIKEIKDISKLTKPTESILILPSDIGQSAKSQAQTFKQAVDISGLIITRMDSSAKAGGALTSCSEIENIGVYFITTGEKINDLEEFNPESFLSRLLGMGDLQGLIEKIKLVTDSKKQEQIEKKLNQGKISLEDVVEQVKSMSEIGGFEKIKSMIPGLSGASKKIPENVLGQQQEKVAKWEHIIKSMTPEEKENPEILEDKKTGNSRITRIAKGAGVHNSEIKSLIKQYKMLNELVKTGSSMDISQGMSQKQLQKMMKKFGKKMRF